MKKVYWLYGRSKLTVSLVSAGTTAPVPEEEQHWYTEAEITIADQSCYGWTWRDQYSIFNGLTAHDGDNQVEISGSGRAGFDDETNTYTFHMAEDAMAGLVEPVTADIVEFTIEDHGSGKWFWECTQLRGRRGNQCDWWSYGCVRFEDKNVAFLDYRQWQFFLRQAEGEDMQTSDFFRNPVGTVHTRSNPGMRDRRSRLVKNQHSILRVSFHW